MLAPARSCLYPFCMLFYQIQAGGDRNFAYLAGENDGGKAAVFDPPADTSLYMPLITKHRLDVLYVVTTHDHYDHTWGLERALKALKAKSIAHKSSSVKSDICVDDEDVLALGSLSLRFLHTPGHTNDSICILVGDKLITGDTLFVGKVGGTDYGRGARLEWESLQNKILTLDDRIEVYPGHDYGVQATSSIGREKKTNPFILCKTFEEFVELKRNWLEYKKAHGIA